VAGSIPSVVKRFAHTVEDASFDIHPFKLHLLQEGPLEKASLNRKDGLEHYKDLVNLKTNHKRFIRIL
jgi:hypothetical protein